MPHISLSTNLRRRLRRESSIAEWRLWWYLRNRKVDGYKFRRQHSLGPYVADFFCASVGLVIEVDGDSHYTDEGLAHDSKRDAWLRTQGLTILRFTNEEVLEHMDIVLRKIMQTMHSSPHPSSRGEEGKKGKDFS